MEDNAVLQRFFKLKPMLMSSDTGINLLLDIIESYLTSDDNDELAAEGIPVLDGQLSLVDVVSAGTLTPAKGHEV